MKRLLILGLLAVCSIISGYAYDFYANGIYYNILSGNEVEVTYKSASDGGYAGVVEIPSSVTYDNKTYRVTSVGQAAFSDCTSLISVTIGNSVTSIGYSAFYGCSGLTSVTIGNSVKNIGGKAFKMCTSLTSITISNSVTSIEDEAFYSCTSLTSVMIPNSVTRIGNDAFYFCRGLTSVTISNSVTSIGQYAFSGCSNLKEVKSGIINPFQIENNVFNGIFSAALLYVPNGTKEKYQAYEGWTKNFKEIIESTTGDTKYTLTIAALGNGSVSYNGRTIRNSNLSYSVDAGTNATITFSPDSGNKIKSVELNRSDVTSDVSNNRYTISNISANTTLEVEFEVIPATTYTLSIKATGNGYVSYDGTTTRNKTNSFTINEGDNAIVTFSPDNGYRLANVWLNNYNVTNSVYNNQYTINNIRANTTLSVEFEAIPVTTYSLSISASGNGYVSYNGNAVRNRTQSFTVDEGASATIIFTPDNGNSISSVKLNYSNITSQISGNSYTISNITANTTLTVTFQEDVNALTVDGLNYTVTSQSNRTVTLTSSGSGQVLTVPATITQNGTTWNVTGIDKDALKGNTELAAIIWNPEAAFTATVSNPNLLLYVKSSDYAPATIQNVVVNGTANNIVLTEAQSGNNFYCPQSFVAQKISYTHNYKMQTGIGEARGWETIALPFDVQTITHVTKGEIKPFANWKSGDATKPFWLYELTGTGFVETGSIKAYTPYIISMPYNPQYDSQWLLNGKVTFAASSVTVGKTENMSQPTFNGRTFIPCFTDMDGEIAVYSLNVNNDYESNNSGMTEGSMFVWKLRHIHPFEAYMTSTSSAPQYAFGVFEGMTTGIQTMVDGRWMKEDVVYDLQGRKLNNPSKKGVYIINGKKKIIK